jgi:hypothetical protein
MDVKLRELLQDNTLWEECFKLLWEKHGIPGTPPEEVITVSEVKTKFTEVIMKLLSYPYNPHDYQINLSLIASDKFSDEDYIDVSLYDPIRDLTEDLSSLPWREVMDLNIRVCDKLMTISDSSILAEVLWELTMWGFDSEVSNNGKNSFSKFLSGFLRDDLHRN